MDQGTELRMSVCSPKAKIVLIDICARHQNGCEETEYGSHVEEIDDK